MFLYKFLPLATWDRLIYSKFSASKVRASCVYARLGLWKHDCGTSTKLLWLVWVHQAWRNAKHIAKVLSLTRYETLMPLIGCCRIVNPLWCKHIVSRQCSFSRHTKWEPERLCSSIHFTSAPRPQCKQANNPILLLKIAS